jgi:hypothetical protein
MLRCVPVYSFLGTRVRKRTQYPRRGLLCRHPSAGELTASGFKSTSLAHAP